VCVRVLRVEIVCVEKLAVVLNGELERALQQQLHIWVAGRAIRTDDCMRASGLIAMSASHIWCYCCCAHSNSPFIGEHVGEKVLFTP
jgi:hypothetical protein